MCHNISVWWDAGPLFMRMLCWECIIIFSLLVFLLHFICSPAVIQNYTCNGKHIALYAVYKITFYLSQFIEKCASWCCSYTSHPTPFSELLTVLDYIICSYWCHMLGAFCQSRASLPGQRQQPSAVMPPLAMRPLACFRPRATSPSAHARRLSTENRY